MMNKICFIAGCFLLLSTVGQHVSNLQQESRRSHAQDGAGSEPWHPLQYPDAVKLCMHELPVSPKEPLPSNVMLNATEERQILLDIYRNLGGHNWDNHSGWNSTIPHCKWYGVGCSNITNGWVIVLNLVSNNLRGILPGSLWKLRNLQALCMQQNPGIKGELRDFLSANMSRLMRLEINTASLKGEIPDDLIRGLKSLVKLQLSGNQLSGPIPPSIGDLSELQDLSLGENAQISGVVPKSIGKLTKLTFLDLESLSKLTAPIELFLNLSSLVFMHLSNSGLQGPLPDDFGLIFPGLHECLLCGNPKLKGRIPSTIGDITPLHHLILAGSQFSGKIPKTLGKLSNLEVLDLSQNSLTGFEEGFVFNSSKLSLVNLSKNRGFNVSMAHLFKMLQPALLSLRGLHVSGCRIAGALSKDIWSFINLIQINVDRNLLTGQLPKPGDNMPFLITLDFSGNNFTGEIPGAYNKLLGLQTFDVSSNPYLKHRKGAYIPTFAIEDLTTMVRKNENDHFTCPVIRFRYNKGIIKIDPSYYDHIYCDCDENYYGINAQCFKCMTGGRCGKGNHSFMEISPGFWPSPSPNHTTHLVDCQKFWLTGSVCNPSGKCRCNVTEQNTTRCDEQCVCATGSTGRFCTKCVHNYYSHAGKCIKCPSKTDAKLYVLLPVVLLGILAVLMAAWLVIFRRNVKWSLVVVFVQVLLVILLKIFDLIPAWLLEVNIVVWLLAFAGRGHNARGILKISLFYFQILNAMVSNFDWWPSDVLKVQRYFSTVFNFKFEGLECYLPHLLTPVGKLSSLLLLPICVAVVVAVIFAVYLVLCKLLSCNEDRIRKGRNFSLNIVIIFLNIVFFPIVKRTFVSLSPCAVDESNSFMKDYPWIDCYRGDHKILKMLGYVSLAVYVIGVPFLVFFPLLLWAFRGNTNDADDRNSWLGSLYLAYEDRYQRFAEIYFLIRRVVFAAILSFFSKETFQTPILTLAFLVSLLLNIKLAPFHSPRQINVFGKEIDVENNLENFNLCVLLVSFVALGQGYRPDDSLVSMVLVINVLSICLCVVLAAFRLATRQERHLNYERL